LDAILDVILDVHKGALSRNFGYDFGFIVDILFLFRQSCERWSDICSSIIQQMNIDKIYMLFCLRKQSDLAEENSCLSIVHQIVNLVRPQVELTVAPFWLKETQKNIWFAPT
jgi:hypothetical protein